MSEENKAVMRRLYEGINNGNLGILDEVYASDATYHGTGQMANADMATYKEFVKTVVGAFPDSKMVIDDLLADGDKVIYRNTYSGTQKGEMMGIPATGKHLVVRTIGIARISGGKIVEEWENMDELGIMQQLGVIEAPG